MSQKTDISSDIENALDLLIPQRRYTTLGNNGIFNVNTPKPYGSTYRGIGSSYFNGSGIANENFNRDLQKTLYTAELNEIMAQNNRDFQERMSRNAYQYAVEDMKKAGINPIMAFSQGGASVPGGATGSTSSVNSSTPNTDPLPGLISDMVSLISGLVLKKPITTNRTIIKNFIKK